LASKEKKKFNCKNSGRYSLSEDTDDSDSYDVESGGEDS
jgi:hypothetical protein